MPDQTAEVQALIDATPNGGTLQLSGEYEINGTLKIWNRKGLKLAGPVLLAARNTYDLTRTDWTIAERGRSQISIDRGSEDISLYDIHVEGSNRTWVSSYNVPGNGLEGQAGFAIGGVKRLLLDHCSTEWTFGDAFSVQGYGVKDVGHFPSEGIWIRDSVGKHIGRIGFLHNQARAVLFERNVLESIRRPWAHAEPNFFDSIVEDIWIRDCDLYNLKLAAYWTGGKPTTTPIRRIVVQGNRAHGVGLSGNFGLPVGTSTVPFPRRENFYWIDNTSDKGNGVRCNEANYVMVRGADSGEFFRCCGVTTNVGSLTASPCNLVGTFPPPVGLPSPPDTWPFTEVDMAYVTQEQLNKEIWDRAVNDALIRQRIDALEVSLREEIAALPLGVDVSVVEEKINTAIAELREDFAS